MGGGVQSREIGFETGDDLERGMTIAQMAARAHQIAMDNALERETRMRVLADIRQDMGNPDPNLRAEIDRASRERIGRYAMVEQRRAEQAQLQRDYDNYGEEMERRMASGRDTPPTMTERMDDNETDLFRQQESERRIMERLRADGNNRRRQVEERLRNAGGRGRGRR